MGEYCTTGTRREKARERTSRESGFRVNWGQQNVPPRKNSVHYMVDCCSRLSEVWLAQTSGCAGVQRDYSNYLAQGNWGWHWAATARGRIDGQAGLHIWNSSRAQWSNITEYFSPLFLRLFVQQLMIKTSWSNDAASSHWSVSCSSYMCRLGRLIGASESAGGGSPLEGPDTEQWVCACLFSYLCPSLYLCFLIHFFCLL